MHFGLFTPPAGVLPDAYRIEVNGAPASSDLDIKEWSDGTYRIAGQLTELFSPEQRRYKFSCELTIARTPPRFIKSANLWDASRGLVTIMLQSLAQ